jgi:uncharacterized MnhB-related membrane protein
MAYEGKQHHHSENASFRNSLVVTRAWVYYTMDACDVVITHTHNGSALLGN